MKGFYTIEGTEGSGKTTCIKILSDLLSEYGLKNTITREPGGTGCKTSEKIRELILMDDMSSINEITEFLLYLSSRKEHIEKVIEPNLSKGNIVISDRYNDSSLAYQGYAKGGKIEEMISLSDIVIGDYIPEKTFFIDIDPKIGIDRIMKNRKNETNRFDFLDIDFHSKVYKGYKELSKKYPNRFISIDGTMTPAEIANFMFMEIINDIKK
ncbi:MAG: dTMP kinase [Mycoplasmataceae bacterium]|nr:dTMP kinase [Mycoplasmataceae bacterium]